MSMCGPTLTPTAIDPNRQQTSSVRDSKASSSAFEMLRGYDEFANEILEYTRGRPAIEWGVV